MRYLTLGEVLELHRLVLAQTGGGAGLRDLAALEAAVAQPRQTFGGQDLYPTLVAKAAVLGFSLIQSHPFVDGNKRVGVWCCALRVGNVVGVNSGPGSRIISGWPSSRSARAA